MKESTLTRRLKKHVESRYGGFWFKVHGGPYQQAGLPDLLGVWQGRMIGFEVKLPGRPHPVTDLQRATLVKMYRAGAVVAVVSSVKEIDRVLGSKVDEAREYGRSTF